jgi:hypothetical protein
MIKKLLVATLTPLLLIWVTSVAPPAAQGQQLAQATPLPAAGLIPLGVTVIEMRAVVAGWSAKKDILGKHVQNGRKEDLGTIQDIIITPKNEAAFAIIGVGGFLGIAERLVAIPTRQLKVQDGHFLLAGATKDTLTRMPPFIYSH